MSEPCKGFCKGHVCVIHDTLDYDNPPIRSKKPMTTCLGPVYARITDNGRFCYIKTANAEVEFMLTGDEIDALLQLTQRDTEWTRITPRHGTTHDRWFRRET